MNQLIILGNGFDLSTGLKTKYIDFFGYLSKKMGKIEFYEENTSGDRKPGIYYKHNESKEIFNFWSGFFTTLSNLSTVHKNLEWMDVERNIKRVVTLISKKYSAYPTFSNLVSILRKDKELKLNSIDEITETYFRHWVYFLIDKGGKEYSDENDIFDLLVTDLDKFEKQFSSYLSDKVINGNIDNIEDENNILHCRRMILLKISQDNYSSTPKIGTQILNFNYTPIYQRGLGKDDLELGSTIKYIHGRLDWDEENNNFKSAPVIFGIDDTECELNPNIYRFGKTYRIMNSDNSDVLDLTEKISQIKFYGHSLNDADYAYFQSIFDKVNLYDGNVKLIFYFGSFEEKNNENKRIFMDRIYRLIEKYGENIFDNNSKVRGKNLLHKLILEGRIRTVSISKILQKYSSEYQIK